MNIKKEKKTKTKNDKNTEFALCKSYIIQKITWFLNCLKGFQTFESILVV